MRKKRVFIVFLFSVFWGHLLAQPNNQLNQIILESVCSYVKDYNAYAKQINADTIRYIWSNGLPKNFPSDSLPWNVFSLSKMEMDRSQKREFKEFVTIAEVSTILKGNMIDVLVSVSMIRRLRKEHLQIARTEDHKYYYYEYNCETNKWEQVIKCIYSDVITKSFVCIQNDSISIYLNPPHLDKPSFFYGTYKCSNDTLFLHDNLLKNSMKPNEYLFVLDSAHQTLSIMPQPSTINDTTPNNPTNKRKMLLGHRFKNTSCFEELKKVW